MFVILHRDFFHNFFCNVKNAPLPQDVLCFSGQVAASPCPQRAATLTARTAGCIYRQGGRQGLYGTRRGGAGWRGRGYVQREARLDTTHTVFLQSSLLGFLFCSFL